MKKLLLITCLFLSTLVSAQAQDGAIDSSFALDGIKLFDTNSAAHIDDLVDIEISEDNEILLSSELYETQGINSSLFLLDSNANLNTQFGNRGESNIILDSSFHVVESKIRTDGKILSLLCNDSSITQFLISCTNPNGGLDSSFGSNGILHINIPDDTIPTYKTAKIIILPNNDVQVLISGYDYLCIVKIKSNGVIDLSYQNNGLSFYNLGYFNISDVKIQKDQKLLISGSLDAFYIYCLRVLPTGNLDSSFGTMGILVDSLNGPKVIDEVINVFIKANGKFLITASSFDTMGYYFSMIQYNNTGIRDLNFGLNGESYSVLPDTFLIEDMKSTIQNDGKILVSATLLSFTSPYLPMLIRFLEDGRIDSTFGKYGYAQFPAQYSNYYYLIKDMELQDDNRIIVACLLLDNPIIARANMLVAFKISETLGIKTIKNEIKDFTIYPNPCTNELFINYTENRESTVRIDIISNTGQVIRNIDNYNLSSKQAISTEDLPAGSYFLTLIGKNGRSSFTFLKE